MSRCNFSFRKFLTFHRTFFFLRIFVNPENSVGWHIFRKWVNIEGVGWLCHRKRGNLRIKSIRLSLPEVHATAACAARAAWRRVAGMKKRERDLFRRLRATIYARHNFHWGASLSFRVKWIRTFFSPLSSLFFLGYGKSWRRFLGKCDYLKMERRVHFSRAGNYNSGLEMGWKWELLIYWLIV